MNNFNGKSVAFSTNNKLAVCSSDGVLHIWDVLSNSEIHQFTPTSHLSATFTCLSWKIRQHRQQSEDNRKRKRARFSDLEVVTFEYIALGTAVGSVIVYDSISGEVISNLAGGHSKCVNDICWNDEYTFYSCSSDQHIIEWDVSSKAHKCKWKADKREVYSIAIDPCSRTLLSAGRLIKLWDLKTKQLLKKFSGHTSPVISLTFVNPPNKTVDDAPLLESLDGTYFISACLDDRLLSAWQIRSTKHKKTSLCSFSLPCEPRQVRIASPATSDEPVHILAVTDDGEIVLFSHKLNGPVHKPLESSRTIKLCTEDAEPLKVVAAAFEAASTCDDVVVSFAYGSSLNLTFEKLKLTDQKAKDVVLIRKDPSKISVVLEEDKLKIKTPIQKRNEISTLMPGVPNHSGAHDKARAEKRKRQNSIGESQMTMEERLNALSVAKKTDEDVATAPPPRADSYAILLSQGLQSNDRDVLNQVLQHANDTLIANTVRGLPQSYSVLLVREIMSRLQGSPQKQKKVFKHSERSISSSGWFSLLGFLWAMAREFDLESALWFARVDCHRDYDLELEAHCIKLNSGQQQSSAKALIVELIQLCSAGRVYDRRHLQMGGKVHHILMQVQAREEQSADDAIQQSKPLYEFQEDSSDEQDDVMDGMMVDDLDEWDKFSDDEKRESERPDDADDFEVLTNEDG